ncbi:MAG: tryptophan--tRNA ligase [Candidatus Moranbacteria bacterium]|nr:tryptophan--tRNA ligase [Candidatus Moranbacteria bacterium]MBP7695722.1 tryptophan--tRNA ligase [Candidatus Moranbacteria bacterium]
MGKSRLFSAVQPSGHLHIGNYLGAIAQWTALQDEYEAIFCIADLHAITVPQDPAVLRAKTLEIAKIYLAAGISARGGSALGGDPGKSILFVQSQVKEHTELMWILNTLARLGDLEKMTQFKDKSAKGEKETAGVGLFDYPVLMAADILLYDTAVVPVGEDQLQHIELARTLARRFNDRFSESFIVPEGRVTRGGARIMGLDDPTRKMSKSAASEYHAIALTDTPDAIRKKIKKAVTDSGSEIVYRDDKPALKNLINIYSLLSMKTPESIEEMYRGRGYGDFKTDLAEVVIGFLSPFQERFAAIADEEALAILGAGAEQARLLAASKMRLVRERVGLIG